MRRRRERGRGRGWEERKEERERRRGREKEGMRSVKLFDFSKVVYVLLSKLRDAGLCKACETRMFGVWDLGEGRRRE